MPTFTVETISVAEVRPGDTVLAEGVPEKITRIAEIDATANNLLMMGKSTRIRLYSRKELIAEVPLSTTVCRLVEDVICVPGADIEYLRDAHRKITTKSPAPERALAAAVWEFLHAAGAEDKGSKAEDEEETEKDEKE